MPRRLLQRYMPHPDALKRRRSLRFVSHLIGNPSLWVLSRRTVANAFMVGLFSALLPIPFQMLVAAFGAWLLRCNLPLSIGLVWITNPLTMPLIFYANYRVGAWLMQTRAYDAPEDVSTRWVAEQMMHILPPLIVGSLVVAIAAGLAGNLIVRLAWRWHVLRNWKRRRLKRRRQPKQPPDEF